AGGVVVASGLPDQIVIVFGELVAAAAPVADVVENLVPVALGVLAFGDGRDLAHRSTSGFDAIAAEGLREATRVRSCRSSWPRPAPPPPPARPPQPGKRPASSPRPIPPRRPHSPPHRPPRRSARSSSRTSRPEPRRGPWPRAAWSSP